MILGIDAAGSLAGPFIAACALLVIAGVGKVARPGPAHNAVKAAGLRVPRAAIVTFGLVEIGAGGAGAVFGGPAALAVAAGYGVLTLVAIRLLVRAPSTPCACLGSSSAVVTRAHVALDVVAFVVAIGVMFGGSPLASLSEHWFASAVFLALVACCVKLAMLALETLPDLASATKEGTT